MPRFRPALRCLLRSCGFAILLGGPLVSAARSAEVVLDFESLTPGVVHIFATEGLFEYYDSLGFETQPGAPACGLLSCADNGTVSVVADDLMEITYGDTFDALQVDVARIPGEIISVIARKTFEGIDDGLYVVNVPDDGAFHTIALPASTFTDVEILLATGVIIDNLVVEPEAVTLLDDFRSVNVATFFAENRATPSPPGIDWNESISIEDKGFASQDSSLSLTSYSGTGSAQQTFYADENHGTGLSEYTAIFLLTEPRHVEFVGTLVSQGTVALAELRSFSHGIVLSESVSGGGTQPFRYRGELPPSTYIVTVAADATLIGVAGSSSFGFALNLNAAPARVPALGPGTAGLLAGTLIWAATFAWRRSSRFGRSHAK